MQKKHTKHYSSSLHQILKRVYNRDGGRRLRKTTLTCGVVCPAFHRKIRCRQRRCRQLVHQQRVKGNTHRNVENDRSKHRHLAGCRGFERTHEKLARANERKCFVREWTPLPARPTESHRTGSTAVHQSCREKVFQIDGLVATPTRIYPRTHLPRTETGWLDKTNNSIQHELPLSLQDLASPLPQSAASPAYFFNNKDQGALLVSSVVLSAELGRCTTPGSLKSGPGRV